MSREQVKDVPKQESFDMNLEKERPYLLKKLKQISLVSWYKIPLFLVSMFLFILAITLMKEGAKALIPIIENSFRIDTSTRSLGFGWLFAYVIMSGSPVAAAALTFFEAGAVDKLDTFAMITGSRLGASFIVLFPCLRHLSW